MTQGGTFITENLKALIETGRPTAGGRFALFMMRLFAIFTPKHFAAKTGRTELRSDKRYAAALMLQRVAQSILRLTGWTIKGEVPSVDKAVIIGAIHTSNWDAFWFLTCKTALDLEVSFLAKHTLFWWPLGPILSYFGAIPVDRSHHSSLVHHLADTFQTKDRLLLGLSPEGTRKWQPYWKTGFYQIAKLAGVPIFVASVDYAKREISIGPLIEPDDPDEVLR